MMFSIRVPGGYEKSEKRQPWDLKRGSCQIHFCTATFNNVSCGTVHGRVLLRDMARCAYGFVRLKSVYANRFAVVVWRQKEEEVAKLK